MDPTNKTGFFVITLFTLKAVHCDKYRGGMNENEYLWQCKRCICLISIFILFTSELPVIRVYGENIDIRNTRNTLMETDQIHLLQFSKHIFSLLCQKRQSYNIKHYINVWFWLQPVSFFIFLLSSLLFLKIIFHFYLRFWERNKNNETSEMWRKSREVKEYDTKITFLSFI